MHAFIERIERTDLTPVSWAGFFFLILMLRYLLEGLSNPASPGLLAFDLSTSVHYTMWYFGVLVSVVAALRLTTGRSVRRLMSVALFGLIFSWLAPVIDLVWSAGLGHRMAYIFTDGAGLLGALLTYFGPLTEPGITPGIRIEVGLVLCAVAAYVHQVTRSPWRAASAVLLTYLTVFFWVSFPSLLVLSVGTVGAGGSITAAVQDGLVRLFSGSRMAQVTHPFNRPELVLDGTARLLNIGLAQTYYLILSVSLAALGIALMGWRKAREVLANSRPERVAHYLGLLSVGVIAGLRLSGDPLSLTGPDIIALSVAALSVYSAWMFAVGVNDLADRKTDAVSNPGRPLIKGVLSVAEMRGLNFVFLVWSVLGGFLLGPHGLFLILAFTAAYHVYSAPPLRLKMVPILATFLISLACLAATLIGYFTILPGRAPSEFPASLAWLIVIAFTLGANLKDLKDMKGDAVEGVKTIPVLLGERRGKLAVGMLVLVSFWLVPLFTGWPALYLLSAPAGLIGFFLVNRRDYRESQVFVLYLGYLLLALLTI